MKKNLKSLAILFSLFLISSCTNEIDSLENLNDPDRPKVLSSGQDLTSVLAGGYASWWQSANRDTYSALEVAGDITTCSWGNFGMRLLGNEPRNSIPNTTSWSDTNVLLQPWNGYYSAASNASDVIFAINNGGVRYIIDGDDQTNSILAGAYFLRGISNGYLGLLFDKALLVDENTDGSIKTLSPYKEIINYALSDLEKSINLSKNNTFTLPSNFINGYTLDNNSLGKLANSYAARFLVQGARTQQETDAIDWNKVKLFAENGIVDNFGPRGDAGVNWWSNIWVNSDTPNGFADAGGRLDMRIIKLLDSSQPQFYPTVGSLTSPQITSPDKRVQTDWAFVNQIFFRPERGKYHFSHYINKRYANDTDFSDGADEKRLITFAKADNDLLLAEANARLNNLPNAVSIINSGTRTTRGNLPNISSSASKQVVLDAIFYERYVELYNSAVGSGFFDRRRTNQLQKGTFRHFPVPAKILLVLGAELYTFGGAKNDPTGMVPHYNIENNPTRTDDTNLPTFN